MTATELGEIKSPEGLVRALGEVRTQMWDAVPACKDLLGSVHPDQRQSACNLIQYLAFRRNDLRPLQDGLGVLGLSSLGRAEAHVTASVDAVLNLLHRLTNQAWEARPGAPVSFAEGDRLLSSHAEAVLGPADQQGTVRIMVTMPSEAARDYPFVRALVAGGMDCMRINCAHDDADAWVRMVEHLRKAEQEVGRPCKVHMDLGGMKLRTGPIAPGPAVLKVRPQRDERGRAIQPARVFLHASGTRVDATAGLALARLPVEAAWLRNVKAGDVIRFEDARDTKRRLRVTEVTAEGAVTVLSKTAYFESGQVLWNCGPKGKRKGASATPLGALPERPGFLLLRPGDALILQGGLASGNPAVTDANGRTRRPAEIGCEPAEILQSVSVGDRVWLDDGKMGGKVQAVGPDRLELLITTARARGSKLRGDKGINFPDSPLALPALTDKDRQDLATVVRYADTVGLSFVRSVQDVLELQESLRCAGDRQPGIILKIETKEAFQRLPQLLLAAMRSPKVGVMIARGDLAVECGYERLAEAQEEILWICEAAHVPVVWATQVLDSLAQEGIPSRAEISDAVLAQRAECVMLNKGPFILPAIQTLKGIVGRMAAHQSKKRARLRALHIACQFAP